jgi:hypothetical protein
VERLGMLIGKVLGECRESAPLGIAAGYDAHHKYSLHASEAEMHFLVVDARYGTPIYVFLEFDPDGVAGYPGLAVQEVTLEAASIPPSAGRRTAIGRDPNHLEQFREFPSDWAVAKAGFILIEPRYVGATWEGYCQQFRPEGDKPAKRLGRPPTTAQAE